MTPKEKILVARGTSVVESPRAEWENELAGAPEGIKPRLAFMQADHHAVRRFVVSELPRRARAMTPGEIAEALAMETARVATIIDELEKALFFVVRTEGNAVSWAFPITVDRTPHSLTFSSGERCFAA